MAYNKATQTGQKLAVTFFANGAKKSAINFLPLVAALCFKVSMGIFSVIAVIPIVFVCAILGIVCLKLIKLPISIPTVAIFTVAGGLTGIATIVAWGFIFSNYQQQLDSEAKILSMFIVAGILSVAGGAYASSVYSKHNKQRQPTPTARLL